ncbi:MAG: phosphatidylcholine and lysophosphatidylcholine phospholipase, partial [Paramarteilia canceri]
PETSSKGIFTIISGRVRAITTKSTNFGNSYKQVEELGQGDSIGINDVLLQTENIATPLYIAIRFTSVVFIHSTVVLALESLLSNSAALLTPLTLNRARMQLVGRSQESTMSQGMLANVKTVAIVGGNDSVNIEKFATYLDHHVKN